VLNHKKLYRLYREERLAVKWRGGRKRTLGTRRPMALPDGANQGWSLDFLSDALVGGRRFRIMAVVDDFTRDDAVWSIASIRRVRRDTDFQPASHSERSVRTTQC